MEKSTVLAHGEAQSELYDIVVDLDGTLIKTDMLVEGLCQLLGHSVPQALGILVSRFRNPERLKEAVFDRVCIDPATLPYNETLLDWLHGEAAKGRHIHLASASPLSVVQPIAEHLGMFTGVLGSTAEVNLKGAAKLAAIRQALGLRDFVYVGDSTADLPIWAEAAGVGTVNAGSAVQRQLAGRPVQQFDFAQNTPRQLLKAMRPHQWVKNVLVFLPLLAAHLWGEIALIGEASLAFVIFSLCASAVYLVNDLLDIEDDRHHHKKRFRPIAAGTLAAGWAAAVAATLMVASLALTLFLVPALLVPLLIYVAATFAYSLRIKALAGMDVVWLAGLYAIRVIGGAVVTGIVISTWLLNFCILIFLSLACAKRCAELVTHLADNREMSSRRGYQVADLQVITAIGVAAGFSAVIVLMIYLQDAATLQLYSEPRLLLLVCVLLLYWQSHLWITVRRNEMHSDPIVFALTERKSQIVGGLMLLSFVASAVV
ncbi:UbiA family prenyltransferase [Haematobacter massiliensis]|uniref:UbiA family prenyltransferase n=1 Tax=Haematobacter massiliensis TaxID=195105 RepID=UPI0010C36A7A|nr:UbiA family prenyltransferase [Haematobacter massiliensis]QBJ22972.1 UbiA family prenyltransferase [Haematobacter massiliensis]